MCRKARPAGCRKNESGKPYAPVCRRESFTPSGMLTLLLMNDITVVVLGAPAEPPLKKLEDAGPGVTLKIARKAEELEPALERARVLFSWSGHRAEIKEVLTRSPRLEWIHSRSAGLDSLLFPELIA